MGFAEPCNLEANTVGEEGEHVSHFRHLLLRASFFGHVFCVCVSHIAHTPHPPPHSPTTPQAAAVEGQHPPRPECLWLGQHGLIPPPGVREASLAVGTSCGGLRVSV